MGPHSAAVVCNHLYENLRIAGDLYNSDRRGSLTDDSVEYVTYGYWQGWVQKLWNSARKALEDGVIQ